MNARWLLLIACFVSVSALLAGAADWPQWRGPDRNGISKETGLRADWPKAGPKLLWQVNDLGYGYSTPAVVGPHLYLLGSKGNDNEFVQALSIKDGHPVWSRRLGKVGNPNQIPPYPGARSTPTVDGEVLYALSSDGDLACLDVSSGNVRWQKSLRNDFGGNPGKWAYAESPLIDGDMLVCTPGGKESTLVALNKQTGAVIWKSAVPGGDAAGYASTVISHAAGRKQYVQFLAGGVVGVDAKTGKFLWRYGKTAKNSPANIPTPVVHGDYVFTGTGLGGGGTVRLKADKDGVIAEEVYFERGLPTSIGGAVVLGQHLYGTNGQQGLMCIELASGKELWSDKSIGAASLCFADGRLYLHGENNEVALVEANSQAYREHGRFTLPDQPMHLRGKGEKAWSYPVVANGRLYIHDVGTLWCYDIKASK
jgi:outer membrane protein assembly factor BamB